MADGDPTLNPAPDDSPLQAPPIVPQTQQQTPTAASPPPAAQQQTQDQDPSKAENVYINKLIDVYNDHKKQDAQYMSESQATWDQFQKKMGEIQNTPPPQLQQLPAAPDAKSKLNWGTAIGDVLAMVAIASTVFGRHGGGYKQAIQMSAVGAFVNGIAKGHEQQAANSLDQWKEQTALIQKQNAEQVQAYKETLADKRLTLTEMMDVIKGRAEATRDSRMYEAAETKDLTEIIKAVHDKTQAELTYRKMNNDATKHMMDEFFKIPGAAGWRAEILKRYGQDADPAKSAENYEAAQQKYPLEEYKKDSKAGTVEEHGDDILGLKSDKKPTEEDTNKIFGGIGIQ
jgi:hypothetical protein